MSTDKLRKFDVVVRKGMVVLKRSLRSQPQLRLAVRLLAVVVVFACIALFYSICSHFASIRARKAALQEQKQITERKCHKWTEWRDKYKACLVDKLSQVPLASIWNEWHDKWKECLKEMNMTEMAIKKRFQLTSYANQDDEKYVMQAKTAASCTVVSLGVGGDIQAEENMKFGHPKCIFYGADPANAYSLLYSQIGRFFHVDVGGTYWDSHIYHFRHVQTATLTDFLLDMVGQSRIDHLWMDNESRERVLLPQMLRGGPMEDGFVSVCQLNVEMHEPNPDWDSSFAQEDFGRLLLDFLRRSDFLLLHLKQRFSHRHPFFINAYDPYCVQRYLSDWCTE